MLQIIQIKRLGELGCARPPVNIFAKGFWMGKDGFRFKAAPGRCDPPWVTLAESDLVLPFLERARSLARLTLPSNELLG